MERTASSICRADAKRSFHALCSAPWDDFRTLYDEHAETLNWNRASYLSIEQQRRRRQGNLPQEHYELAVLRHQITTGLEKLQHSVASGNRNTDPNSVARRVARVFGSKRSARYFSHEMVAVTSQQQARLPKPRAGCKRPAHRFCFSFDEALQKQDERYDGRSVLVTTVMQRSADELFSKFKQQTYAEHANHIFKGPLAVRPVFLKNVHRVEALVFLMMMSLTLYFILQRTYRSTCEKDAPKKERRTTTRTILSEFNVYIVLVTKTDLGRLVQPLQPTPTQRTLLRRLNLTTVAQILSNRLPRPPT